MIVLDEYRSNDRPPSYVTLANEPLALGPREASLDLRTLPPLSEFSSPPASPTLASSDRPLPALPALQLPQGSFAGDRSISAWSSQVTILAQPAPRTGMTVAGAPLRGVDSARKESGGEGYKTERREQFSAGLCGCAFWGCCYSCWCPCLSYSRNKQRLGALQRGESLDKDGTKCCGGWGWLYGVTCLLTGGFGCCVMECCLRRDTRKRYGIESSCAKDCALATFCQPCALQQESHELEREQKHYKSLHEMEDLPAGMGPTSGSGASLVRG